MHRLLNVIVLLVVATAMATAPAIAGKAGGGSGAVTGTVKAWVSGSPNPAQTNSRVDLTGCGFEMKPAEVRVVHSAGYTEVFMVGIWSPGCFDGAYFLTREAGTYRIDVYQSQRQPQKPKVLKASTTLIVG